MDAHTRLLATRMPVKEVEALEEWLRENDPEDFGCACIPDKYRCGPCTARHTQRPFREAAVKMRRAIEGKL